MNRRLCDQKEFCFEGIDIFEAVRNTAVKVSRFIRMEFSHLAPVDNFERSLLDVDANH